MLDLHTADLAATTTAVVMRVARAARPWRAIYNGSHVVPTVVVFVHLAGLVVAAGFALVADRATWRLARDASGTASADAGGATARGRHLAELRATHGVVVGALAVVVASGVLLALADVETFAHAPVFWLKLTLVALLLVNGGTMRRIEVTLGAPRADARASDAAWRRLRAAAVISAALWFATILAGVALTNT